MYFTYISYWIHVDKQGVFALQLYIGDSFGQRILVLADFYSSDNGSLQAKIAVNCLDHEIPIGEVLQPKSVGIHKV